VRAWPQQRAADIEGRAALSNFGLSAALYPRDIHLRGGRGGRDIFDEQASIRASPPPHTQLKCRLKSGPECDVNYLELLVPTFRHLAVSCGEGAHVQGRKG
jgi:hypothetical protein